MSPGLFGRLIADAYSRLVCSDPENPENRARRARCISDRIDHFAVSRACGGHGRGGRCAR